ncbi:MAG: isochorismatase family protein [Syntrophorhabdaceae bacterium]|nr:isochorismatase family protein [Syntrophorhabdaceae bacterium]
MSDKEKYINGLIGREDAVLVIIDAQEKLLPVISNREGIVQNMLRLVKFAKITGIPMVLTEQEKLGSTIPEIKNEIPGIDPIKKLHFNCFFNEAFTSSIEALKRKTLIVSGVEAHICVLQTAIYASCSCGYNVHVIADAVSSRVEENRRIAIDRMARSNVTISSTETFIYEILKVAGTDEFRSVLSLVK